MFLLNYFRKHLFILIQPPRSQCCQLFLINWFEKLLKFISANTCYKQSSGITFHNNRLVNIFMHRKGIN